jgi:hypothetical protein
LIAVVLGIIALAIREKLMGFPIAGITIGVIVLIIIM